MKNEHMVIPDTQCKPGVSFTHLEALGNYAADKQPQVIVHLGDHFDMHSLSSYDKGTKHAEGARYQDDINAGVEAMEMFIKPIDEMNRIRKKRKLKLYKPRMEFLIGNHEQRIERHVNSNPELYGKLSYKDFELERFGWTVNDFLVPVEIDGVTYSHFFYNENSGKPWAGTVATMLNNIGFSFTMGHRQGLGLATKPLGNGRMLRGLVAGSFYQHHEHYKGPQGNNHWQGAIYKHEVKDGNYSLMELSLSYLLKEWL